MIAVVVPCYNEEKRLDVDAFLAALGEWPALSFRMVDDGSKDGTLDVLRDLEARAPAGRVRVHVLERNSGKAEAVRQGVLAELEGDASYVGYWDADLATPLDEIPVFATILDERADVDIVLGSRVKLLGRRIERRLYRHLYGRLFATSVSLILGLPVYDTQCGAKLFRNSDAAAHAFGEGFLSRWIFDVEMLARFVDHWRSEGVNAEDRIVEKPLRQWVDVAGSKIGVQDAARAFVELAQIRRRYRRVLR
ncbi:MAG: glycosyltransferase [Myxococcota bacterium]